jgi:hypothetical protein
MKERVGGRPLWYASLFVVGVSLSVVSSTNDFLLENW